MGASCLKISLINCEGSAILWCTTAHEYGVPVLMIFVQFGDPHHIQHFNLKLLHE
jgi:hypothetical protein